MVFLSSLDINKHLVRQAGRPFSVEGEGFGIHTDFVGTGRVCYNCCSPLYCYARFTKGAGYTETSIPVEGIEKGSTGSCNFYVWYSRIYRINRNTKKNNKRGC